MRAARRTQSWERVQNGPRLTLHTTSQAHSRNRSRSRGTAHSKNTMRQKRTIIGSSQRQRKLARLPAHPPAHGYAPDHAPFDAVRLKICFACSFPRVSYQPVDDTLDPHAAQPTDRHTFPRLVLNVIQIQTLDDLLLAHVGLQVDFVPEDQQGHLLQLRIFQQSVQLLARQWQPLSLLCQRNRGVSSTTAKRCWTDKSGSLESPLRLPETGGSRRVLGLLLTHIVGVHQEQDHIASSCVSAPFAPELGRATQIPRLRADNPTRQTLL
jgi:hypothetical protein